MTEIDVRRVKDIVETWNIRKTNNRVFTRSDLLHFVEINNAMTKRLISELQQRVPEWWQEYARVAEAASIYTAPNQTVDDIEYRGKALRMVNEFGVQEHDFYVGLMELAINAVTLTTPGARIIADGVDRTDA